MNDVVEVAAGLVFRDGTLLITRRHPEAHLGGLWEFPGGKREPDETFELCLQRELREELGIEIAVGELLKDLTHAYPDKTVRLLFYRCKWLKHEPQTLGCAEFKWVQRSALGNYEFPAADASLLAELRQSPDFWK